MKIISYREIVNPNLFVPEEVLMEIFKYLPLESLYKFMCVSKVWFSLLTTISKTLLATHYAFYNRHLAVASSDLLSSNFAYDGFSFELFHTKLQNLTKRLCLLGSSNGLVLLATNKYKRRIDTYNYYVFNPLTKRISDMIPKPEEKYNWRRGWEEPCFLHGFVCQSKPSDSKSTFTSNGGSNTFMIVRIEGFENLSENCENILVFCGQKKPPTKLKPPTKFEIQVFSSDLGEWNVYEVSSPLEVTWEKPYKYNPHNDASHNADLFDEDNSFCYGNIVITNRSVMYWFEGERQNRIISYDLNKNEQKDVNQRQCKLIDLPRGRDEDDYRYQCLGESEELICYCQLQRKAMNLCIWVNNKSAWELVHKIELENMLACDNDRWFNEDNLYLDTKICPLVFHPVDRHVVLLAYSTTYILALNGRTNRFDVLKRPAEELDACPWLRSDLPLVLTPSTTRIPRRPEPPSSTKKSKSRKS